MSEVIRVVTGKPCPLWEPNSRLDNHAMGDRCLWCEGTKFFVEYLDPQLAFDAERLRADTAVAEVAALREELAEWKARCGRRVADIGIVVNDKLDLQQRLTAAEQRNALMVELLTEHQWEWEPYDSHTHRDGGYYCVECQEPKASGHEAGCKLAAALQPTESGASEPQCLLCLDAKTVQGNIHGGFVKDCPDCCSEEG